MKMKLGALLNPGFQLALAELSKILFATYKENFQLAKFIKAVDEIRSAYSKTQEGIFERCGGIPVPGKPGNFKFEAGEGMIKAKEELDKIRDCDVELPDMVTMKIPSGNPLTALAIMAIAENFPFVEIPEP